MWTSHGQPAANRPTDCVSRQRRGGPALSELEPKSNGFRLMRLLNPDLYTHTRIHGYKHAQKLGTLPSAAFSIE